MRDGMKKATWIGMGAVLGLLLSLNLSVFAQRESRLPIPYEDLQLLSAVFGKIKSDYVEAVPDDKLIKEAINGMVRGLDPHSDFLDAEAFHELQVDTQGRFGGLGIEVGVEEGVIRVVSPIEDTPAFKAGIKAGDLIVKIDDTATRGMPLSKAVEKMRGKPGSSVLLTIVRKDVDTPLTFTLVRQEINVKSIRARLLEPGYGYIRGKGIVEAFVEKPAAARARKFVASRKYTWNSGMFMLRASCWQKVVERFAPDIAAACRKAWSQAGRDGDFLLLRKPS